MCLACPDCNTDHTDAHIKRHSETACSDYMGSNSKAIGGYAGLCSGLAIATEYQGEGTPHGHGFAVLANMYQHHNLDEIRQMIEHNRKGISPDEMLQRVTHFVEHLQREDHFDNDQHQKDLPHLEEQFHANNAGVRRNHHLSVRPECMYTCTKAPCMWSDKHPTRSAQDTTPTQTWEEQWQTALAEAEEFRQAYEADVQFVFSRVQHH